MTFSTLVGEDRRLYRIVFLALLALALYPILANARLPLHDYPNHVARAYILHHLNEPAFAPYRAEWRPYPNLAMELVVMPLQRVMSINAASKIFEALIVLLSFFGADLLGRQIHGKPTLLAPVSIYFLYSLFMLYGFTNYLFGLGMFYLTFAVWLRAWKNDDKKFLLLSFVLALASYLAHLSSYVFFAMSAGLWALLHFPGVKKFALYLLPVIPPAILNRLAAVPTLPDRSWESPFGKLKGAAGLFLTYHWKLDIALVLLIVAGLALAYWQRKEKFIDRPTAIIAAIFFVAFLAAPSETFGSWALDRRFLIPGAVLAMLSLRLTSLPGFLMIAGASAVHLVVIAVTWAGLSARAAADVAMIDAAIAPNSRIAAFTFLEMKIKSRWPWQMPFRYAFQWAVIDRNAYARGLFAYVGQQPLRELPSTEIPVWPEAHTPVEKVSWPLIFKSYDAFFAFQLTAPYREYLAAHCEVAGQRDEAAVYRNCH